MILNNNFDRILIIDFGSQFTQLIARRIRELGVYSEIISHKKLVSKFDKSKIKGVILSGGPLNVYQSQKVKFNKDILESNLPILGICFGHQIIAKSFGGKVELNPKGWELGSYSINLTSEGKKSPLFNNFEDNDIVYESHLDYV